MARFLLLGFLILTAAEAEAQKLNRQDVLAAQEQHTLLGYHAGELDGIWSLALS